LKIEALNVKDLRDLLVFFAYFFVFIIGAQRNVRESKKAASNLVIIWNIYIFTDLIPFCHFLKASLTCNQDCELFEKLGIKFGWVARKIFVNPLVFTSWVHSFQSVHYNLSSFHSNLVFSHQKVHLKIILGDNSIVIDSDIDTS
jgi:hypothetical protein